MLSYSGLDIDNYSNTLIGWASLPSLQYNVKFGVSGLYYNSSAIEARNKLINDYKWTIVGDSLVEEYSLESSYSTSFETNNYIETINYDIKLKLFYYVNVNVVKIIKNIHKIITRIYKNNINSNEITNNNGVNNEEFINDKLSTDTINIPLNKIHIHFNKKCALKMLKCYIKKIIHKLNKKYKKIKYIRNFKKIKL